MGRDGLLAGVIDWKGPALSSSAVPVPVLFPADEGRARRRRHDAMDRGGCLCDSNQPGALPDKQNGATASCFASGMAQGAMSNTSVLIPSSRGTVGP
jgi:hypothetical protein